MSETNIKTSIKRVVLIALVTIVAVVTAGFLVSDHILSNAAPRAKLLGFSPVASPVRAQIDLQTEPHTCGLHSLRSIYRAYGLDPDEHALRTRLGVDIPAVPTQGDTTGTLQPDITRVLAQDGFLLVLLGVNAENAPTMLENHLARGQHALALIRKPDNGNLHWIVLQAASPGKIEVIDSLVSTPQVESSTGFLTTKAVDIFLLEKHPDPGKSHIKEAHRMGLKIMKQTPSRVDELKHVSR